MKAFEYKTVNGCESWTTITDKYFLARELGKYGKDGWELVHMLTPSIQDVRNMISYTLIFKRELLTRKDAIEATKKKHE